MNNKEKMFLKEYKNYTDQQKILAKQIRSYPLTNTVESDLIKMWKKHFGEVIENFNLENKINKLIYKEINFIKKQCEFGSCKTHSTEHNGFIHCKCLGCKYHCDLWCVWYIRLKRWLIKKYIGGYFRSWFKKMFWWLISLKTLTFMVVLLSLIITLIINFKKIF